ncbi:MAG: HEAT repeat domain-containing protein [Gammaproteobacteria bacterium]|nr:HEAT repeat domain-containing protein [Gammaproteobacteria bacterium]
MKTVMTVNLTSNKTSEESFLFIRKKTVHTISQWLKKGDELDRCCACRSLGSLGDRDSVAVLIKHLRDDDIDVCIDAAEALGDIGDNRAVTALLESLNHDPDGDVKTMVVGALGKLGGEQAVSRLLELAISPPEDDEWDDEESWDSNWDIQIAAVQALAQLRVSAAVLPFCDLLADNECQVDRSSLFNALAHIGGTGEQVLVQKLNEDIPRERRRAAYALGINCTAMGARALGRALQDPEAEVRTAAADALASGKHRRYLSALLILLRDPEAEVRETVLRAVNTLTGSAGNISIIQNIEWEKLLPLLDDNSPQVRAAALKMLYLQLPHHRIDKEAEKYIQARIHALLKDPHPAVSAAACPLSVMFNSPKTRKTLLSLAMNLQGDSAVRQQAITALGQYGDTSEDILMCLTEILNTEDSVVLFTALQALLTLHMQGDSACPDNKNTQSAPLEIILAALQGDVIVPLVSDKIADADAQGKEVSAETATTTDTINDPEPPDTIEPVSTLDSIALGNAELARQLDTKKIRNADEAPELPPEEMETFQPYYDILQQQKSSRKKFTRNKTVNIAIEVRRLSARILGGCSQPDVVKALTQTLYDENPEVQHEAIAALAHINPDTPGITETLGPLTSFLHLGNTDLRIVSATALGALGNLGSLPGLLNCLDDESRLVRNQAVVSVAQRIKAYVTRSLNTDKPLAVARKQAQEEIADVEYALRSLVDCLDDSDVGVRKTTALTITELGTLLPTEILSDELHREIVERLIKSSFYCEGQQAKDMAKTLRLLDPNTAGKRLVSILDNLPSSAERRIAMEMLEEIFQ